MANGKLVNLNCLTAHCDEFVQLHVAGSDKQNAYIFIFCSTARIIHPSTPKKLKNAHSTCVSSSPLAPAGHSNPTNQFSSNAIHFYSLSMLLSHSLSPFLTCHSLLTPHHSIHWLICAELQKKWQKSKSSKNPDIEDVIAFTAVYCLFIGLLHQMCPYLCCIFNALGDKCIMRAVGHMCVVYVECVCVFYPTMLRSIYAFQIPLHYLMRSYASMYYIYTERRNAAK